MGERLFALSVLDPDTECWLWLGSVSKGHGRLSTHRGGRHVTVWAHIVSYEFFRECVVAPGLVLDHTCDNGLCINPMHVTQITRTENSVLRWSRRR